MSDYKLDGYVDVAERLRRFYQRHPDGRIGPLDPAAPYEVVNIGGDLLIVYTAAAYRTPDDPLPGVGVATERYPGLTPYTRGSEVMNAETSAWGRAIVATGILATDEGIASAQEVANRRDEPDDVIAARNAKAGLLELVSGDKAVAASLWAEAGLEGAHHLTQSAYDELLDLARTRVEPFPIDDQDDDEEEDAEEDAPPLPAEAEAAIAELKAPPGGLDYELGLEHRNVFGVAQALAPILADGPSWSAQAPAIVDALQEVITRVDELKLREFKSSGLWDVCSGGSTLPTKKAAAEAVIVSHLTAELDRYGDLAAVAAEFSA